MYTGQPFVFVEFDTEAEAGMLLLLQIIALLAEM